MTAGDDASLVAAMLVRSGRLRADGTAPALVLNDPADHLCAALRAREVRATTAPETPAVAPRARRDAVVRWSRFATAGRQGSPWPPPGRFGEAWVRMPRSGLEAEMLLHAAAARVPDGARVFLFGATREGIRSAAKRFPLGTTAPRVEFAKRRCRTLSARRLAPPPRRDGLEAWATDAPMDWGSGPRPWRHYPGVFAHGRLDAGTALLAEHLPQLAEGNRLLDYGAGTGVLAAAALERAAPGVHADLLDHDAVALAAARRNLPDARTILGEGPGEVRGPYDLIVSNPPLHQGRDESLLGLEALVLRAPAILRKRGRLLLVAQRRRPVASLLARAFARSEIVADRDPFRVWAASARDVADSSHVIS